MVEGIRHQNLNDLQSTSIGVHHQTQFHSFFQNPFSNFSNHDNKGFNYILYFPVVDFLPRYPPGYNNKKK